MEKPFDVLALVAALKGQGLDVAEDLAKVLVKTVFVWVEDSIKLTPTIYDDLSLPIVEKLKTAVLEKIDLIDGEKD